MINHQGIKILYNGEIWVHQGIKGTLSFIDYDNNTCRCNMGNDATIIVTLDNLLMLNKDRLRDYKLKEIGI